MGYDIHMYVEKYENNEWIPVAGKHPMFDFYYNQSLKALTESERILKFQQAKNYDTTTMDKWFYCDRNYTLFSLLANVRNYDGEIEPISEPRGIPEDVSDFVNSRWESWHGDGHSDSYFTLKELLDFNWEYYKDSCSYFISRLEILKKISDDYDNVRLVFWFDN